MATHIETKTLLNASTTVARIRIFVEKAVA
jgi:hypothetical protein